MTSLSLFVDLMRKVFTAEVKQYYAANVASKSPLKRELAFLRKKIDSEYSNLATISDDFFARGGVCCPSCGVPGYSERLLKQERREKRVKQIIRKLAASQVH